MMPGPHGDQHLLLAGMLSGSSGSMTVWIRSRWGRKALAPARCTLAIRLLTALADLNVDRSDAGLDLLEGDRARVSCTWSRIEDDLERHGRP